MQAVIPLAVVPFMGTLVVLMLVATDDRAILMAGALNMREA